MTMSVCRVIKECCELGVQVGVVVGGGNFWRGRSSENMDRTKADQIGMLATVMNCIYVSEMFRSTGLKTAILTPFMCGSVTELFSKDLANSYFEKGTIVFFAGGTGHPYFSTDTGIVLRAVEMDAEAIYLAKAIDGVYDSDPKVNPNAVKYDEISIDEVIDKKLAVIDMTASVMCMEHRMPLVVFGLNEEDSIINTYNGNFNGTQVTV
jgi:uridylate kinase